MDRGSDSDNIVFKDRRQIDNVFFEVERRDYDDIILTGGGVMILSVNGESSEVQVTQSAYGESCGGLLVGLWRERWSECLPFGLWRELRRSVCF